MPNFKEVFLFTEGDKGFTEVWFSDAPTIGQAAAFGTEFFNRAVAFRNALTVLRKIRISDVANNRSTLIVNVNRRAPFSNSNAAISGAAAVYTINAPTTASRRQVWFRGLDAAQVVRDPVSGADMMPASLDNAIKRYITALQASNYRVRALSKVDPITGYNKVVSVQSVANSGRITLTTEKDHGYTANNRIILGQFNKKDYPGLNGHYTVLAAPTPTTLLLAYNLHVTGTFLVTTGRIRIESYTYGLIDAVSSNFNFFGTRDTGRSPLGGRGRRTATHLRSA